MSVPAAPWPAGFRERLLRNTLFGIGGRLAGLLVPLLLTPYVVRTLGSEAYALYALAGAVTGYLSLLDLGLGTGYVKYVAEAAARDDRERLNQVVATGLYAHLAFGAALLALWWPLRASVVRALGIAPALRAEAADAFTLALLVLALSGAAAAFRAVLYGLQRIDVATRIGVALLPAKVALVVGALRAGLGVRGLLLADLVLFLAGSAALAVAARRLFPPLDLGLGRVRGESLRRLLGYGLALQVSRLSEMVNFQLDKLLLARFVGLAAVTEYELAGKVLSTLRSLPLLLVNAVVPAVSELDARGAGEAIERLASRLLRLLLAAALPLFALAALEAPLLVRAWLGPGHEGAALAIRVLALGYALNVASGAFTAVTQGIGRTEYQLRVALVALLLNAALSPLLVRVWGFPGVLVGTSVSLAAAYAYAEGAFRRLLRESLGRSGRLAARLHAVPAAAALLAAALVAVVTWGLPALVEGEWRRAFATAGLGGSGSRWLHLGLAGALFAGAYAALLDALGGVEPAERALARDAVRSLRGRP